jgi:uncharacterized damage-inducible protein DinB
MNILDNYLQSALKQFRYYKSVGEKTIDQLSDTDLFIQINEESNSIAMIIQHICGNMLSRFTDFLNSDGEKEWRNRDAEFEATINNKTELMQKWNEAWECFLNAVLALSGHDLAKLISIRGEQHTVLEALNRQLAHYPYHIGQIVFVAKYIRNQQWHTLTIPKGKSEQYNAEKFGDSKK